MKSYLKAIKIFILLSCIFCSCKTQPKNQVTEKSSETVVIDIPHDLKGRPLWYYQKKGKMEKMVGLSSLENGFDSLQIRIWYGVALRDKLQLLLLKKSNAKWSAELDSLVLYYDKNHDSLVSVTKHTEIKQPLSGWEKFIDSLYKSGILVLPDANAIKDYEYCQDGDGVTVEIAMQRKYRIYNYPCFNSQIGISEAKKVELIIQLLEKEFSFSRLTAK